MNATRWSAERVKSLKGQAPFACSTAYDYAMARLVDAAGIPLILVGDSLGMAMLGYSSTIPVTMAEMLHHTAAVSRGAAAALVVGDMPFMSFQGSPDQAVENAGRFLKEAGAGAVKIEGGEIREPLVDRLVRNGIPVLGHIGLTPQSIRALGGYKVQGRKPAEVEQILKDAQALERAGAFAVVIECVPAAIGREVTESISIPTIGIGAGPHCDGQILVLHDLLGFESGVKPRFVKAYADLDSAIRSALDAYRDDVAERRFPGPEHAY